jgi:hypothetical protein
MGPLISLLIIFSSLTTLAQTSTYQNLTDENGTTAEILLSRGQGSFVIPTQGDAPSSDVQNENVQINVLGAFNESYKFRGGLAFMNRHLDGVNDSYNVSGLGNVNLSGWGVEPFETFTLSYGVDTSLSLAPANYADVVGKNGNTTGRWSNNFTGYNSYTAFLGTEFIISKVTAGVRGNLTLYQSRFVGNSMEYSRASNEGKLSDNASGVGAQFFAELPLHKLVKVGVSAGTEASSSHLDNLIRGTGQTSMRSAVYGQYKYDLQTAVLVGLSSQSNRVYLGTESTDLTVGLTRVL